MRAVLHQRCKVEGSAGVRCNIAVHQHHLTARGRLDNAVFLIFAKSIVASLTVRSVDDHSLVGHFSVEVLGDGHW